LRDLVGNVKGILIKIKNLYSKHVTRNALDGFFIIDFLVQFSERLLQQTSLHIRDSQLFMHMTQLINKQSLQGLLTIQLFQYDDVAHAHNRNKTNI